MFHLELRQFPHVARAFNLTGEELETRILTPWARGQMVQYNDRRWGRDKARLTIYEGPELRPDEIGLGRGWANVTRAGEDVTERTLTQAQEAAQASGPAAGLASSLAECKRALLQRCAAGPCGVHEAVVLAGDGHPQWRASDRLALAERCVWELLREGRVRLVRAGEPRDAVDREQWASVLLAWATWADARASLELELL